MRIANTTLKGLAFVFICLLSAGNLHADKKAEDVPSEGVAKAEIKDKKIIITNNKGKRIDYRIKGICYAPDTYGETYCETYEEDIPLVKKVGANSVRTYRPLGCYEEESFAKEIDFTKSRRVLEACKKEGLTVTVGFSYEDMSENGLMDAYLKEFGTHPAILIIALGNEYNYHYGEWFSKDEWLDRLKDAVSRAKKYAPDRIIATVHGEMPSEEEYSQYMECGIDLIMMNIYRGSNFGFAPQRWHQMSETMPWVVGEFGRSSKNADGHDTSNLQASYLQSLIRNMENGYLFSLTDDPGKGSGENSAVIGREDSLGIYGADRKPKKAVEIVKSEYDKIRGAKYID